MKTRAVRTKLSQKQQWEQSEAVYHYHMKEKENRKTQPHLTGFSDRERDVRKPGRMREIFKAENSYGTVAAGVSRKKEAAVVFSQKREHNGPAAAEPQKKLHMERAKREILPAGSMYLNPDMEQTGAAAFIGKKSLPVKKTAAQIQRYSEENTCPVICQRMPFLDLKKERAQAAVLERLRRRSRETGERVQTQLLDERAGQLRSRIAKKEQAQRQMMKKLREAWKKAQRMFPDDFRRKEEGVFEPVQQEGTLEDTMIQPEPENSGGEEHRKTESAQK